MNCKIKVCGITRTEDAIKAEMLGAWAIGFIFYPKSPRYIEPEKALEISQKINLKTVGVFVNETPEAINKIAAAAGLEYVQLHSFESVEDCRKINSKIIKNIRTIDDIKKYDGIEIYMTDAADTAAWGGTGKSADWEFAKKIKQAGKRLMLSGGLSAENIRHALMSVNPDYIDISSSIELSAGIKDHQLMEDFFEQIRLTEKV